MMDSIIQIQIINSSIIQFKIKGNSQIGIL